MLRICLMINLLWWKASATRIGGSAQAQCVAHCLGKNCPRSFRDFTIISRPSARLNRSMQNGSHLKVIFDFEFWSQNFVGVWCKGSFALVRAKYSFHEVLLPKLRALDSFGFHFRCFFPLNMAKMVRFWGLSWSENSTATVTSFGLLYRCHRLVQWKCVCLASRAAGMESLPCIQFQNCKVYMTKCMF